MNIDFKIEKICVTNRINAEDYFIEKYRKEGYNCCKSKQIKDNINNNHLNNLMKNIIFKGIPDLVVWNENEFFFIEVKTNGDSLRTSQIDWINKYPKINVTVYHLEQDYEKITTKTNKNNNYKSKSNSIIDKKMKKYKYETQKIFTPQNKIQKLIEKTRFIVSVSIFSCMIVILILSFMNPQANNFKYVDIVVLFLLVLLIINFII